MSYSPRLSVISEETLESQRILVDTEDELSKESIKGKNPMKNKTVADESEGEESRAKIEEEIGSSGDAEKDMVPEDGEGFEGYEEEDDCGSGYRVVSEFEDNLVEHNDQDVGGAIGYDNGSDESNSESEEIIVGYDDDADNGGDESQHQSSDGNELALIYHGEEEEDSDEESSDYKEEDVAPTVPTESDGYGDQRTWRYDFGGTEGYNIPGDLGYEEQQEGAEGYDFSNPALENGEQDAPGEPSPQQAPGGNQSASLGYPGNVLRQEGEGAVGLSNLGVEFNSLEGSGDYFNLVAVGGMLVPDDDSLFDLSSGNSRDAALLKAAYRIAKPKVQPAPTSEQIDELLSKWSLDQNEKNDELDSEVVSALGGGKPLTKSLHTPETAPDPLDPLFIAASALGKKTKELKKEFEVPVPGALTDKEKAEIAQLTHMSPKKKQLNSRQLILPSPTSSEEEKNFDMYLDYPLKCPILTCQMFQRLYTFYDHMEDLHSGLNVGEAHMNEILGVQIFLDNNQGDEPFCHGYFTLHFPIKESGPAWKQRIPVLLMSRIVDLRDLGFTTWRGNPISELYFMVWFIGIQCTGLPALQVEMETELFGLKVGNLRCAQKPQDVINLIVTHSAIFFTKHDMNKFAAEPSPYMQVKLKVCERIGYQGFQMSRVQL